jgi:hypothetical protein
MQKVPPRWRRMTEKERADHEEWEGTDQPIKRKKGKRKPKEDEDK